MYKSAINFLYLWLHREKDRYMIMPKKNLAFDNWNPRKSFHLKKINLSFWRNFGSQKKADPRDRKKERKKGCHMLLWLIFSWLFNFVCAPKRKRKEKHPIVHWAHIVTRRQLDLVTGLIFKARKGGHWDLGKQNWNRSHQASNSI